MRLIDAEDLISFGFDDENGNIINEFVPKEFIDDAPTIDAVPVEIIDHYMKMWKAKSESDHFSDRIANGLMAQAAEIILKYHEMNKAFYVGSKDDR